MEKKPLNEALGKRIRSERAIFRASGRYSRLLAIALAVAFVWVAFAWL